MTSGHTTAEGAPGLPGLHLKACDPPVKQPAIRLRPPHTKKFSSSRVRKLASKYSEAIGQFKTCSLVGRALKTEVEPGRHHFPYLDVTRKRLQASPQRVPFSLRTRTEGHLLLAHDGSKLLFCTADIVALLKSGTPGRCSWKRNRSMLHQTCKTAGGSMWQHKAQKSSQDTVSQLQVSKSQPEFRFKNASTLSSGLKSHSDTPTFQCWACETQSSQATTSAN